MWPKGEVVIFTRLSEPCSRLRVCVEVMASEAPGGSPEHAPEEEGADKPHKDGAPLSPTAAATTEQHLRQNLARETCEGVVWLALSSLVATGGSTTPLPADAARPAAGVAAADGGASGGQVGGEAAPAEGGNTAAQPKEEGLLFVTPRDGLRQKIPEAVRKDAWYDKHCSVLLAYRPERIGAGVPRLVIRLHSIHLPLAAHELPTSRVHFKLGPDAAPSRRGHLAQSFVSGAPMRQEAAARRGAGATLAGTTLAFRSRCVASLEVAGRTQQEQEASELAISVASVDGKEVASALLTMGDIVRIATSSRAAQPSAPQHLTTTHHSPVRTDSVLPLEAPGSMSGVGGGGGQAGGGADGGEGGRPRPLAIHTLDLKPEAGDKKPKLAAAQTVSLCMELSLQGDWSALKRALLPQT